MFTAALFTVTKLWKQLRCPSINEWRKKKWHIHAMEYYSPIRINETLLFVTTWMDLEDIMLGEIS